MQIKMTASMSRALGLQTFRSRCDVLFQQKRLIVLSRANFLKEDSNLPSNEKADKISPYKTEIKEITTHTGQRWDEDDYRLLRFTETPKQVNPRFAIDLVAEEPPIAVKGRNTYCDGGDGPLGHPKVFINLDQPGNHTCGYCGLRFYQDTSTHH